MARECRSDWLANPDHGDDESSARIIDISESGVSRSYVVDVGRVPASGRATGGAL